MSVSLRWLSVFVSLCLLVIVPFTLLGSYFEDGVVHILVSHTFGYLQIALIIALLASDILLPVPSSLIATYAGAALGLFAGSIVVWTGLMLGAVFGFVLGRGIGATLVTKLFSPEEIVQAQRFFETYGASGLVLSRPVPVLAEVAAFGAGLGQYSAPRYFIIMGLTNAGLSVVYAYLGTRAEAYGSLLLLLGASILVPLVAISSWRVFKHIKR